MMIDRHIHDDADSFGGYHATQQLQHVDSSASNNHMNELNLSVVNEAYGNHADLYLHVLRVKPNAGSAQIQEAYFDRRNELFHLLSQMNRTEPEDEYVDQSQQKQQQKQYNTERKMDAVVCAVRILGDPDLRLQYDDIRTERIRLYNRTGHHGTTSPNTTITASSSTITHKNRNQNGMISPSSTILSPPSPNSKQLNHNIQIINTEESLSLFPAEAIPDVMNSTGTVSTADNIQNDNANTSSTFLDYFSIHESMNISNYFETTINSYYSTSPTAAATTSTIVNVDSEGDKNIASRPPLDSLKTPPSKVLLQNDDDKNVPNHINSNSTSTRSTPIPLTSSKRRDVEPPRQSAAQMTSSFVPAVPTSPPIQKRIPLALSTPLHTPQQTLQRRITSNGTTTTDGDGSTAQYSKESTLYYDDDDEEEETYYTMDEDEDDDEDDYDDDDDESRQPTHGRSKTQRANRSKHHVDPASVSCFDHGIDRIRVEMLDAIDDTMIAFEQVLNVFTLQEDDIVAVMSRIDKAKRQVANTHILYPNSNGSKKTKGTSSYDELHGDDYDTDIIPTKSNKNIKSNNKKSKQVVLPPPPTATSTTRNRKVKSSTNSSRRKKS